MLAHLLKYAECNVCVLNEIRHLRNWCDFFACVFKKVANWYSDHQLLVVYDRNQEFGLGSNSIPKLKVFLCLNRTILTTVLTIKYTGQIYQYFL